MINKKKLDTVDTSKPKPRQQCQLRYINLSWNDMEPACMDHICKLIDKSPKLEKLLLHHNKFGRSTMEKFKECLKEHKSIKYLDISANHIRAQGMNALFELIATQAYQLHTM